MKKLPNWLRWSMVLPGAIFTAVVLTFFNKASTRIFWPDAPVFVTDLISACVAPASYICVGCYIAPKYRFGTGVVLVVIHALFMGAAAMSIILTTRPLFYPKWTSIGLMVVGVISTVVTSLSIRVNKRGELLGPDEYEREERFQSIPKPTDFTRN